MSKHLDITIDFETCALSPCAAPLTLAAVAWDRNAEGSPFFKEEQMKPFQGFFDLRDAFLLGLEIDESTQQWWRKQNVKAQEALLEGKPELVSEVVVGFMNWMLNVQNAIQAESVCLWSQGTDIDIALLRKLCRIFDIDLEECIPHTQYRDCRTIILEAARIKADRLYRQAIVRAETLLPDGTPVPCPDVLPKDVLADGKKAYPLFEPLPRTDLTMHNALFDTMRSSWITWQALQILDS